MKVLFTISNAHYVFGGTALTCADLIRNLTAQYSHECRLYSRNPISGKRIFGDTEIFSYRDSEDLKRVAIDWKPDVVVGVLSSSLDAASLACYLGIPFIVYLIDFELAEPTPEKKKEWLIPSGVTFSTPREREFILKSADVVFACSKYMQKVLSFQEVQTQLLYPEIDCNEVICPDRDPSKAVAVTAVCGYRHKGIEILLELAARFPEQSFCLAGEIGGDIDIGYRARLQQTPNLTLLGRVPPKDFLRQSRVVIVPSQWPEPFGRIAVEALANGIAVLASESGGLTEIVQDRRMLVAQFGDSKAWSKQLERLLGDQRLIDSVNLSGRAMVKHLIGGESTRRFHETLLLLHREVVELPTRKVVIYDEGCRSAFSLANKGWSAHLRSHDCRVIQSCDQGLEWSDVCIHHNYSLPFMDFVPPSTGKCVAIRTWDFGRFPVRWVEKINREFDQYWAYSHWIKDLAIASGVEQARVRVVPLGFDPAVHRPDGDAMAFSGRKRFTFGFVGGAVVRKGVDILLKAYSRAFTAADNVRLVIKDHSRDIFYEKSDLRDEIHRFMETDGFPQLIYIDDFLSDEDLATLHRAFDAGVFPYRAEGFCLPILELMAAGVPSIVPDLGPCADYCDDSTSYLVPALRINLPVNQRMDLNLGFEEHIDEVEFCEVRVETLSKLMRKVYEAPLEARRQKAECGVVRAHENFTWAHSGQRVLELLDELRVSGEPLRLLQQRRKLMLDQRKMDAAMELLRSIAPI